MEWRKEMVNGMVCEWFFNLSLKNAKVICHFNWIVYTNNLF